MTPTEIISKLRDGIPWRAYVVQDRTGGVKIENDWSGLRDLENEAAALIETLLADNEQLKADKGRLDYVEYAALLKERDDLQKHMEEALANQRRRFGAEYDELAEKLKEIQPTAAAMINDLLKDKARLDWLETRPVNVENLTRNGVDAAMRGEYDKA